MLLKRSTDNFAMCNSEMLRLRDETRLVLEMNVQSGVAPQYITATHEDRSRENADLAPCRALAEDAFVEHPNPLIIDFSSTSLRVLVLTVGPF